MTPRQCPRCQGKGTIVKIYDDHGIADPKDVTCYTCDGSGKVVPFAAAAPPQWAPGIDDVLMSVNAALRAVDSKWRIDLKDGQAIAVPMPECHSTFMEEARPTQETGAQGNSLYYRVPVWKCKTCGCLWRDNLDGTVSLFDAPQKSCATCERQPTRQACDIHWLTLPTPVETDSRCTLCMADYPQTGQRTAPVWAKRGPGYRLCHRCVWVGRDARRADERTAAPPAQEGERS